MSILRNPRQAARRNSELHPGEVAPFGRYGAGIFTAHPVGLLVVLGLYAIGFEAMPEARWFFTGVLAAGGACGFFLWLRHR